MKQRYIRRQVFVILFFGLIVGFISIFQNDASQYPGVLSDTLEKKYFGSQSAAQALESLDVKGRAPKTGYQRSNFGNGWLNQGGCDTRNIILKRDLIDLKLDDQCKVLSGKLNDPYTGQIIDFQRGPSSSQKVQIDHVVALSDAWQKGAQQLNPGVRVDFANDPLNLLAVDGAANQAKGDGDAATWLPPNKSFRCQYVARQVAVKKKYNLWLTDAEKRAISNILISC